MMQQTHAEQSCVSLARLTRSKLPLSAALLNGEALACHHTTRTVSQAFPQLQSLTIHIYSHNYQNQGDLYTRRKQPIITTFPSVSLSFIFYSHYQESPSIINHQSFRNVQETVYTSRVYSGTRSLSTPQIPSA